MGEVGTLVTESHWEHEGMFQNGDDSSVTIETKDFVRDQTEMTACI